MLLLGRFEEISEEAEETAGQEVKIVSMQIKGGWGCLLEIFFFCLCFSFLKETGSWVLCPTL